MHKIVTIIIPCRNEKKYIPSLLNSIIGNDYSKDVMEVLVIDGMSDDGTREILETYSISHPFIKTLDNIHKTVPQAMNIGIKNALGEFIIRMDAHATYPKDYISKLVYYSERLNADNVGGRCETLPANETLKAKAIALVLSHPFGVGDAEFRINKSNEEYVQVDTVPFGCYKKSLFDKIGFYDEELIRNQDNELNERLLKNGGKIYLIPSINIQYFARENYQKLWKMLFQYGYFGPLVDIKLGKRTRLRRYIPAIYVLSLALPVIAGLWNPYLFSLALLSGGLHMMTNIYVSSKIAIRSDFRLLPYLMTGFTVGHLSYGIGYLKGMIDFHVLSKHKKNRVSVSLSR
jgi:glycosyltransferase involved in cell wall biosynthesis